MPCVQAKATRDRAEFVRLNRKDVDVYSAIADPVELIERLHSPPPRNELERIRPPPRSLESVYRDLTLRQVERLAAIAVRHLESGNDELATTVAGCLVSFANQDIDALLEALAGVRAFYPAFLFRRASDELARGMIDLVRQEALDPGTRNHLLRALAWIGTGNVVELFAGWQRHRPGWASDLHVPPQDYSLEAGWELSPGGERRDLHSRACVALVPGEDGPLDVRIPWRIEETCAWCGEQLTVLFAPRRDLTSAPRDDLPTGFEAVACTSCTPYSPVFLDSRESASRRWHPGNPGSGGGPGREPLVLPERRLKQDAEPRGTFHAADWCLPTTFSQIGGHPTWIDDASYPRCIECGLRMPFVGQLDASELDHGDGIFHVFRCSSCSVVTAGYQQT